MAFQKIKVTNPIVEMDGETSVYLDFIQAPSNAICSCFSIFRLEIHLSYEIIAVGLLNIIGIGDFCFPYVWT